MRQGCDEKRYGARFLRRRPIEPREIECLRRNNDNITSNPFDRYADGFENFDETIYLLDMRHALQSRLPFIEKRRGKKYHRSILGDVRRHFPAEVFSADDTVIHRILIVPSFGTISPTLLHGVKNRVDSLGFLMPNRTESPHRIVLYFFDLYKTLCPETRCNDAYRL